MLQQRIEFQQHLAETLSAQLKAARAELKKLQAKQAKLNKLFEMQSELLADPDVADSLAGGDQTPEALRLIEIETDDDSAQVEHLLSEGVRSVREAEHLIQAKKELDATKETIKAEQCSPPEQEEKIRDAAAKLTVIWEGAAMGKTIDAEGVERRFYVKKWDAFRLGFILETSSGKAIESNWKNAGVANNSHFYAIKRSQHEQFLKECKKIGVNLSLIESDNVSRTYAVYRLSDSYKPGEKLGTITQSFDELWHIGNGRFYPHKYAHIHNCLAALKIEIEAKEATADIGF